MKISEFRSYSGILLIPGTMKAIQKKLREPVERTGGPACGLTHRTVMIRDCSCWVQSFFIKLTLSTVWNFSVLMKNTGPRALG